MIGQGVPPALDLLRLGLPLACELGHSRLNVFENSHVAHGARTGSPGREEEALRAHADVGEGLQQACRNRPLRVSCRTLGKEALDTGLEGTLEGLQIDEEVLLKRRQLEMGDEAKSATHSRARALCKRALLRRAGGSAHVRSFANARTHSFQRSPTHSRAQALRAHALCKRALLHHALTPAISSTSVPAPRRRDAATDTSEAEACETDT